MTSDSNIIFQNFDVFTSIASFLMNSADVCHLGQTCRSLAVAADQPAIWWQHFLREKIPFVKGENRDFRADFKILHPITLSGRKIERFFGEFIGDIPKISLECFNTLSLPDPFEAGKRRAETFVFIVEPPAFKRRFPKNLATTLDAKGQLKILPRNDLEAATETELEIPFTLYNLRMLCCYPLSGKEHKPVFNWFSSIDSAFQNCAPAAANVNIHFMRKLSPRESFSKDLVAQLKLFESKGLKMTSTRVVALYNATQILTDGTCPDRSQSFQDVRTVENVKSEQKMAFPYVIGRFVPKKGLEISCNSNAYLSVGAVPSISAETETEESKIV